MTSGTTQATPGIVPGSGSAEDGGDSASTWLPIPASFGSDLLSVQGCQQEIQDCSRGLAYLDHIFGIVLSNLDDAETTWNSVEADAAQCARADAPKAATAVEIKGGITRWVQAHPSALRDRENVLEWRRRLTKVERWMRTLEKRLSAAQSAQKGHEQLGRYGGGE